MKYELDDLDFSVRSLMGGRLLSEEDIFHWKKRTAELSEVFQGVALSLEPSKKAMYIRWHQEGLMEMSNLMYEYLQSNDDKPPISEILALVESLLDFLNRSFPLETASYVEISISLWDQFKLDLQQKIDQFKVAFKPLNLDPMLTEFTLFPLSDWLDKRNVKPPTYQQYRYVRCYADELEHFLMSGFKVTQQTLLSKFIELDFNHLGTFKLWVRRIELALTQHPDQKGTLLKKLKHKIEKMEVMPYFSYNGHIASLKDQLRLWLEEEICILC